MLERYTLSCSHKAYVVKSCSLNGDSFEGRLLLAAEPDRVLTVLTRKKSASKTDVDGIHKVDPDDERRRNVSGTLVPSVGMLIPEGFRLLLIDNFVVQGGVLY